MGQSVEPSPVPATMRALAITAYGKPSTYGIATVPSPKITQPDEVLIKVHAASINPIDITLAGGALKMVIKDLFPVVLGYDAAGTIVSVGSGVQGLNVGDEVFTRVPNHLHGTIAEYCISSDSASARKPVSMTFSNAASIPLVGLTALQAIRRADAKLDGGLKGKTAFVPGGLSGTGSLAVQLLRNVFGVKRVITTLSPGKIKRAKELWKDGEGEVVCLDYTKDDVNSIAGLGTIDFMLDTMGSAMGSLPIIRRGGVIVTISKAPSGDELKAKFKSAPWLMVTLLNLIDALNRWRARRYGVNYSYMWMNPDAKGLQDISRWVEEGRIRPLVGRTAQLEDLGAVQEGCEEVHRGKGGVGKFVIEVL